MNYNRPTSDNVQDTANKFGTQLTNGLESAVDTAHDAAVDTLSKVSDKIDSLQDKAKPAVDRMVARGKEIANDAIAGTRDAGVRAKTALSGYASSCETYITEQPMRSVAIAAAVGATLAAVLLLSRNRSNQRARYNDR
jgi:ElaB/YqjD/DUF883 family membrane-anchored ribosome-binding protein